jgi:hypothetical protein
MNFKQWLLSEVRQGLIQYLKEKLPHVPDYVLFDLFYKNIKNSKPEEIEEFIKMYEGYRWELKTNFHINYEIFDASTIQKLKIRKGGTENPYGVPNDKQRHDKQKELIAKEIPKEPIILIKNGTKYELLDGWHRTIQLFEKYPKGFVYPQVYIGVA